jgi:hypothetical protein
MRYHQCKVDSSEGRLEEPEVDGDVKRNWSLSGGDDLKELVSIVLEIANVKAIDVYIDGGPDTQVVIEPFLQGLCTNHTIVSASFEVRSCGNSTSDVLDKSADMLCHNIGLKRLRFILSALPKPECFRFKNEAFWFWQRTQDESQPSTS